MAIRHSREEPWISIGVGEASYGDDPDFHRLKQTLRIVNPFDIEHFEQEAAARVVGFYVLRATRQHRQKSPRAHWLLLSSLIDRYSVAMKVQGFESLAVEARHSFLNAVHALPGVSTFESTRLWNDRPPAQEAEVCGLPGA